MGLKYEKDLAKALPTGKHGQWFRFVDQNGPGHCQPDIILDTTAGLAILEAKYTWTPQGHKQIELLYRPVVALAMGRPCFGLVVCRVLTRDVKPEWICRDLSTALLRARLGLPTVLHWIAGLGPLNASSPTTHLASASPPL